MQVNPQMGAQIQEQSQKRKAKDQQLAMQKRTQAKKEIDALNENIAKFDTFEEAKAYAEPLINEMLQRYPKVMKGMGEDAVFDEDDYQQAKSIYGKEGKSMRGVSTTLQEVEYLDSIKDPKKREEKEGLMMELKGRNKIKTFAGNSYLVGQDGSLYLLGTSKAETEFEKEKSAAKKEGTITGEARTTAKIDLPKIKSDAEYLKNIVQSALDHPGFESVVGMPSIGKLAKHVGGTKEAAFMSVHNQINNKAFVKVYQEVLKGGGQITEIEGEKATAALHRLNTNLSEKEYIAAAKEFIFEIDRLTALTEQRSSGKKMSDSDYEARKKALGL